MGDSIGQCLVDSKLARVSTARIGSTRDIERVQEGSTRLPLFTLAVSADVEYLAANFVNRVRWAVEKMHRKVAGK